MKQATTHKHHQVTVILPLSLPTIHLDDSAITHRSGNFKLLVQSHFKSQEINGQCNTFSVKFINHVITTNSVMHIANKTVHRKEKKINKATITIVNHITTSCAK